MGGGDACDLRHRAELPWGHETCEGCAEMSGGDACELCHWDFRQSEGCAEISGGDACELCATGTFGG
eukprot:489059-Pyramimonas_sp.AAC.1